MANERNLIPQSKRTKSEQREIARKGGQVSGERRRERKLLREVLLLALNEPAGENGQTSTEAIAAALIQQALRGNTKAFEIIRDTIGEKPTDRVVVTAPDYSALDRAFEKLEEKQRGACL